jgi:hypothetical protein
LVRLIKDLHSVLLKGKRGDKTFADFFFFLYHAQYGL